MLMYLDHLPLNDSPSKAGLFADVGDLSFGPITLRLRGHFRSPKVNRPFYWFNIVDPKTDEMIGEITFMPESDQTIIASVGNAGGKLTETNTGKGHFGNALSALAPLARRHKLSAFLLVIPKDNAWAIAAAKKLQSTRIEPYEGQERFIVRV